MEHHEAAERQIRITSPDGKWWAKVWFRLDQGERIQFDLPAGSWAMEEASLSDGPTRLILRKR